MRAQQVEVAVGHVEQIQMGFEPHEDRVLLRMRASGGSELRFWLTRRYVRMAWPALSEELLRAVAPGSQAMAADARREVAFFEHQSAVSQADFHTPFREDALELPLGPAPVLLARFQLKRGDTGDAVLCLHPHRGAGVELALNRALLHSFCKLLADSVAASGWDLALPLPDVVPPPPGTRAN